MSVALVTGAGRGIGRAIASRLARDGRTVVCTGREGTALQATVDAVQAAGGEASCVPCDLRDADDIRRLARVAGRVDVLVANAGIAGPTAPLWEVEPDEWEDTLRVNLTSTFLLCRALLPDMLEGGSGSVVVVGSVTARKPLPGRAPYAASKSALVGLVRSLAMDAGPFGVRVNLVSPGPTGGDRFDAVVDAQAAARGLAPEQIRAEFLAGTPLRRLTEPEDVADAVAYLSSDGARAVTGVELTVACGGAMA